MSNKILNNNSPCTGTLQKSSPKSFFIRFGIGSEMESYVFPKDGQAAYVSKNSFAKTVDEIIVLQVMYIGNNYFLVEAVKIVDLKEETCTT